MDLNVQGAEAGPPLWQTYLLPEHYDVHLHALNRALTKRLGLHLDAEVEDTNENGVIGDFGGLAELIGYDFLEIQAFERGSNRGYDVLNDWRMRDDLRQQPTVGNLVENLLVMGREDILTDCHLWIAQDIQQFLSRAQNRRLIEAPVQDQTVSQGPGNDEVPPLLCLDDVMTGKPNFYDAFVCYNARGDCQRDLDFVREMVSRLEGEPYFLRLFVPSRDELAGLNEHKVSTTVISQRCRHMIVVLSNNFLASEVAEFQSSYAFALSPSARERRIVPVMLENCSIPNIMTIMARLDFTKQDLWDWSWKRLAGSITQELFEEDFVLVPSTGEGEAMEDTDDGDSAVGSSIPSMDSSPSPVGRNHTAPISRAPHAMSSKVDNSQRPFTANFASYSHGRRASPKPTCANLRNCPQMSGPPKQSRPSGSISPKATSPKRSVMQRFSDSLFSGKSKKSKKGQTATTTF